MDTYPIKRTAPWMLFPDTVAEYNSWPAEVVVPRNGSDGETR